MGLAAVLAMLPTTPPSVPNCYAQSPPAPCRVVPIEGEAFDGILIAADTQKISFEAAGSVQEWASDNISRIEWASKSQASPPPLLLGLVDGSYLRGTKLVGKEQAWQFGDSAGGIQEFGPSTISSLLVRVPTPELTTAWFEALKEPSESDALIVIRPGNVVDRVAGIISEVKDRSVVFDLDGQSVDVSFEKILGLIWFRKSTERLKPKIQIDLNDGSSLLSDSLSIIDGSLKVRILSGREMAVPISRVTRIDYVNANVKWLSDLTVLGVTTDRGLAWQGSGDPLSKMLAPRFVSGRGKESGRTSVKSEDLDLTFLKPGSITFRIPDGFSRLRARVERTGSGDLRSDLTVEVFQEDNSLLRYTFDSKADMFELDLPVSGGKRMTLAVSSKTRLQVGSQITWRQPRLTR
jgi:hypothetical protein